MRHQGNIAVSALTAVFAFLFCYQPRGANAEQHIACPASVDARQVRVESPSGWTGVFGPEGKLPLEGAQAIFVVGSLHGNAWGELKDPPTMSKGNSTITTYPLPAETDKYVICSYGDRIYQAIKLPAATTQCNVFQSRDTKGTKGRSTKQVITDVVCR